MDKYQLRDLVQETLKEIELHSSEAVNLILGTIAQESRLGHYIKQLGGGPALGICQMETNTHNDIWYNYLKYKKCIARKLENITCSDIKIDTTKELPIIKYPLADEMRWNLKYAIAMCRIHYLRVKEPIPFGIQDQAKYWKKYYNSYLGAGTEKEYIENYNKYVIG